MGAWNEVGIKGFIVNESQSGTLKVVYFVYLCESRCATLQDDQALGGEYLLYLESGFHQGMAEIATIQIWR